MRHAWDSLQQPIVPICPQLNRKALTLCNLDPNLDLDSKYRLYLNQVALETTLDWFTNEMVVHPALAHQNWLHVNGSALLFKDSQKTVVIIPSNPLNCTEMIVSDYWIQHCCDYFFSVQINLDERWLKFQGYTTCKALKRTNHWLEKGTYTMRLQELITDIAVFSVVNKLCPPEVTQ